MKFGRVFKDFHNRPRDVAALNLTSANNYLRSESISFLRFSGRTDEPNREFPADEGNSKEIPSDRLIIDSYACSPTISSSLNERHCRGNLVRSTWTRPRSRLSVSVSRSPRKGQREIAIGQPRARSRDSPSILTRDFPLDGYILHSSSSSSSSSCYDTKVLFAVTRI